MKQVKKTPLGYDIGLKVANMRKAQSFSIYPFTSSSPMLLLQSNGRIIEICRQSGKGYINHKNVNYPSRQHLQTGFILSFQIDDELLAELNACERTSTEIRIGDNTGFNHS